VQTDANEPVSELAVAITDCAASDFDAVFPLLQQLWPAKSLDRDALSNLFGDALLADSRVLLCARLDHRVVGFGSMTLKTHLWHGGLVGWVDELVVDGEYRGRGIGRMLLARLMETAAKSGCRAVELDSAFHRKEAHAFYEKLGFEKRAFLFSKTLARAPREEM
jgi:glucosamine-phosphate N-acetyltransferase